MSISSQYERLDSAVEEVGFVLRGGFHCMENDVQLAGLDDDQHGHVKVRFAANGGSVLLIGNAGTRGFTAFRQSPEWSCETNPLERFTERVVTELAAQCQALAVFPHRGPPWLPFQSWARRAQGLSPSPMGILMDPRYGLWHAYRAALIFSTPVRGLPIVSDSTVDAVAAICRDCQSQACLHACPVDAYSEEGFHLQRCDAHLHSDAGHVCREQGCLARNACPVAGELRYGVEQQRFHLQAFINRQKN